MFVKLRLDPSLNYFVITQKSESKNLTILFHGHLPKKNAWNFQKALKTKQQDFFLNFNKFCKYCQELPSEHLLI